MEPRSSKIFKLIITFLIITILTFGNIYYINKNESIKFLITRLNKFEIQLKKEINDLHYAKEDINASIKNLNDIEDKITSLKKEYFNNIKLLENKIINGETEVKIAYLTFDDGPYDLTKKYLEVLQDHNVRGTFFVLGKPKRLEIYKKIIKDGHTIANHTYSHQIKRGLYKSTNSFINDVIKLQNFLHDNFEITTNILRFPGGSSTAGKLKTSIVSRLRELGYGYVDWTSETGDGSDAQMKAMGAYERFVRTLKKQKIAVVLMHDYSRATYKDLPKIITYLKNNNYLMLPLFRESTAIK